MPAQVQHCVFSIHAGALSRKPASGGFLEHRMINGEENGPSNTPRCASDRATKHARRTAKNARSSGETK